MADSSFADIVNVSTGTIGTGAMSLGSAVLGFRDSSALTDGLTYSYSITDGSARETGHGVYTASGPTLTRVLDSSTTGSLLVLSGVATVLVDCLARDLARLPPSDHDAFAVVSGNWYSFGGVVIGVAAAADNVYVAPIWIPWAMTISDIGVFVSVGVAGKNAKLGIYADNNGQPGALLRAASSAVSAATSAVTVTAPLTSNLVIASPRWIWCAMLCDGAVTIFTVTPNQRFGFTAIRGSATAANVGGSGGAATAGYLVAQAYASGLPNPFGTPTETPVGGPRMITKAA